MISPLRLFSPGLDPTRAFVLEKAHALVAQPSRPLHRRRSSHNARGDFANLLKPQAIGPSLTLAGCLVSIAIVHAKSPLSVVAGTLRRRTACFRTESLSITFAGLKGQNLRGSAA